jgi:prevent-host-death family protein
MSVVDIHEAKTHLSGLVDEALSGGEVIISRANRPLVKLVPVTDLASVWEMAIKASLGKLEL